jgi:hypothetical protein
MMTKLDTTHLRTERRTTDNKGFAIAGVPCFADTFVQDGSSVLRTKFSAKTPRHRKPPNVIRNHSAHMPSQPRTPLSPRTNLRAANQTAHAHLPRLAIA